MQASIHGPSIHFCVCELKFEQVNPCNDKYKQVYLNVAAPGFHLLGCIVIQHFLPLQGGTILKYTTITFCWHRGKPSASNATSNEQILPTAVCHPLGRVMYFNMVGPPGLEPGTGRLKVCCDNHFTITPYTICIDCLLSANQKSYMGFRIDTCVLHVS